MPCENTTKYNGIAENIAKLIWWHIKKYNYIFQSFQYIALQNVCAKK